MFQVLTSIKSNTSLKSEVSPVDPIVHGVTKMGEKIKK